MAERRSAVGHRRDYRLAIRGEFAYLFDIGAMVRCSTRRATRFPARSIACWLPASRSSSRAASMRRRACGTAARALEGVVDRHLHPLEPRAVRAYATWKF
jgi:hypothetical protein